MYIAFSEEEGKMIRYKYGMMVIEYKRMLSSVHNAIKRYEYAKKILDGTIDAAINFIRVFCEALDNVRLAIEKIKDAYRCDTSQRYHFVKFFSKLGYDERKMWTLTRHTRLARSDC